MAQVSSGSVSTTKYESRYLKLNWSVDSTNISENYKKISWSIVGAGGTDGYWYNAGNFKAVIDGKTVYSSSDRIKLYKGTVVASGYTNIYHDAEGNKTFTASIEAGIYTVAVNCKGSGTFELPTIPRYATSNQSLNSKTETTITMNWSSDSTIDYLWYSTDWGTNWIAVGSVNATSGTYTINKNTNTGGSLSANTTYNVMTKVRRKDSQLTTNSSKLSVTTYDYPYCTESPDFTIGNALTISLYNPLGRSVTIKGVAKSNNTSIFGATNVTGTSAKGFNDSGSVTSQYSSIPNAKSGTYKVEVTYGSITKTRDNGNTYSIKGTETPTAGSITYADTNTTVTAITGNNQHIVQNYSNLKVTYTAATGKNSATIKSYSFVLNGVTKTSTAAGGTIDFGKINSASNLTLTMTVTDSRGLTTSATKTITILPHNAPTAIVTLERLNNYEDETYLTVDGAIASVNSKNKMTVTYRYKQSGGSYNSFVTIGDNVKQTLSLDKNNVYIFNIVITDAFGSTYNKEHRLEKGKFPLFIDTEINAVGINEFPSSGEALRIKDGNLKLERGLNESPKIQVSNGSVGASLHIGAGGVNRGIWDETDSKWMLYNDGTNIIINSNLYPISRGYNNEVKDTEIFDAVQENESLYRSGLYSVNDGSTWYNVINVRHRNGYSDGLDYGLQIRKPFGLNSTIQVRSQNSKTWSGWEAIYRSKTLYDNSTGSNETITLNETCANFSYIEIFYRSNDYWYNSVKIANPNEKKVSLDCIYTDGTYLHHKSKGILINGTSISNINYITTRQGNNIATTSSNTNNIYITKVIGLR